MTNTHANVSYLTLAITQAIYIIAMASSSYG